MTVNAQTAEWVKQAHFSYSVGGNNVCIDKYGNVYVAGDYKRNSFDKYSTDPNGAFLMKYNSSGSLLWQKTINTVTPSSYGTVGISGLGLKDNLYPFIIGGYGPDAIFDSVTLTAPEGGGFIAQYDDAGNVLWVKSLQGSGYIFGNMKVDEQQNYYVVGSFRDTITFDGISLYNNSNPRDWWMFIAKFNSNGKCVWAMPGQGHVRIKSFYVDKKGTSYIGGDFGPVLTLNDTTILMKGSANGFIAKYDSSGSFQWVQNIGSYGPAGGQEEVTSVSADNNGNVYASGSYDQDLTIGSYYLPSNNTYFPKSYTAKFDINGNCLNADNSNYEVNIINNTMYKCGFINSSGMYGNIYLHLGYYVMQCDASGNGLWAYQPIAGNINGRLNADSSGNLYLTGGFDGTVDFGGITVAGNKDMYIAKIKCDNISANIITDDNSTPSELIIYPNPTRNRITFIYQCNSKDNPRLKIYNNAGQLVFEKDYPSFSGLIKDVIDLNEQNKGIYFIEIISGNKRVTKRVVVN